MLEFKDPWKELRKDLFGNTEPEVKIEAMTIPVRTWPHNDTSLNLVHADEKNYDLHINCSDIEMLPAIAASTSYGRREKIDNIVSARKLNKKLIENQHLTPFEAVQINLFISGISKACGAQLSRYRSGNGHVSASRRFKDAKARFIYPVLDYLEDKDDVRHQLETMSSFNKYAFTVYEYLRDPSSGSTQWLSLHKEDARMALPVSYSTERSWFVNARELRYILEQRLALDAEWEIRRLATMIYNLVCPLLPSVFEDIGEKFLDNK